jgi:hypothetical protein
VERVNQENLSHRPAKAVALDVLREYEHSWEDGLGRVYAP